MSIIGFLLLIFVIFFIIIPLAKAGYAVWRARRNWNEAMNQFRRAAGFTDSQGAARNPEPAPKARKKKIDPDTGEYIAFEEIKVEASQTETTSSGSRTTIVEEQIQDITWEDIK